MLAGAKKAIPGFIESHEQNGQHPLLLSDASQAKMRFVKDMREGKIYLKDYDDYIDVYRAHTSGLKVICVSHFPKGKNDLSKFVEKNLGGVNIREKVARANDHSPVTLCANPANLKQDDDAVKMVRHMSVASVGLENRLPRHKWTDEFANVGMTIPDFLQEVQGRDIHNIDLADEQARLAVARWFLEEYPQFRDDEIILINTLGMGDPHHNKALRDHIGLHPTTMMGMAEHTSQEEVH